jgi:hypothetical protein
MKEKQVSKRKSATKTSRKEGGDSSPPPSPSRRKFLGNIGGITAATIATNIMGLPSLSGMKSTEAEAAEVDPLSPQQRRNRAFLIRRDAALRHKDFPLPDHPSNGDEERYQDQNFFASYSKGLPHNDLGEVDPDAYSALIKALSTGLPADFEAISMGCPDPALQRRLVNPQAALAFDLEGADSHALAIPPAPRFSSAQEASEIAENYWMALLRDVPFNQYGNHPLAQAAADDLSNFSDFRGPKRNGRVTPQTLFRGNAPGVLSGPYISQFLLLTCPFGANFVNQQINTVLPGINYMIQYDEWLDIQRGCRPTRVNQFDSVRCYIRNGRDLGQWVHIDVLFQAYFMAMLIMLTPARNTAVPSPADANSGGIAVPFDAGNPYRRSRTQEGFGTFGGPYIASLMCEVATRALKAVWYQKWSVHRRLRPEAFAGRIHNVMIGAADYPINSEILSSPVLDEVFNHNAALNGGLGTYLLPMAFPEGSPLHPAYGAGHATVAGACTTILKAFFDESFVIPDPVVTTDDGLSLVPFYGPPLTVGGELNKLAFNVALGRDIAGVHWRSDAIESLKLGERVAISILRDQRATYNENFGGFSLTRFDGTTVIV